MVTFVYNPNQMKQTLASVTVLVNDYDEAIDFYTSKLNFKLKEDSIQSETKRWVIVSPPGSGHGCNLLLAKAANDEQRSRIGNQTGGRVFLFLYTDNFKRDYAALVSKDVRIEREPSIETYGTVAVFADLYGNLIDLIEPLHK
jgi:catechol 2,3-dioxygenase-like lactoylglutathione lyase family enzyme